jgi:hypothetical protein
MGARMAKSVFTQLKGSCARPPEKINHKDKKDAIPELDNKDSKDAIPDLDNLLGRFTSRASFRDLKKPLAPKSVRKVNEIQMPSAKDRERVVEDFSGILRNLYASEQLLKKEPSVLTIACGFGWDIEAYLKFFGQDLTRVVAVELDTDCIEAAKQDYKNEKRVTLLNRSATEDYAAGQTFSLVVIRHPEVCRETETWRRITIRGLSYLEPGGVFLMTFFTGREKREASQFFDNKSVEVFRNGHGCWPPYLVSWGSESCLEADLHILAVCNRKPTPEKAEEVELVTKVDQVGLLLSQKAPIAAGKALKELWAFLEQWKPNKARGIQLKQQGLAKAKAWQTDLEKPMD